MPNIVKRRNVLSAPDSVCIPDVVFAPLPEGPEQPEGQEGEKWEAVLPEEPERPETMPAQHAFTPNVMTRAELTEYYGSELEDVYREAAERAYAEALHRKKGELTQCIERVDRQLEQMQEMQSQYMRQYAQELKFLAVEIAEKMILHKIDEDDQILTKLVMQTVAGVKNANWLNVEVSEHLVTLVDTIKQELTRLNLTGRINVSPAACPDDTCRVSTEDGTIVASISVQAQNLREAFRAAEKQS